LPTIITPRAKDAIIQSDWNGTHVSFSVIDGGQGYRYAPNVIIQGGGGVDMLAQAILKNGVISAIDVHSSGSGYSENISLYIEELIDGNWTRREGDNQATLEPVFDEIVQFGNWLLPLSNGTLKLGASWQWQPLDEKPNEKTSAELLARFYQHFPHGNSTQLLDVNVGIRPGTRDKHPFLGTHPTFSQLTVFNGFGSKGSLLIPWYSDCFLRHLTVAETLPQTVDIHRYKNDYFTG
ncbi:MAG: FAD-dependent oxidoreductase, partial [Cycloclasticus sp.]